MSRQRTIETAPPARAGRGAAIALALSTLAATSSCSDEPVPAASGGEALVSVGTAWTVGTTAIEAVDKFYKARNWFNCAVGGNCAQTEAHIEATRVINELGALLEKSEREGLMADALSLLDDAKRDYGHPELLSGDEEGRLLSQATGVFRDFYLKLLDTNATDAAQVDSAYRLARMFNVVAALVDNIGQLALQRGLAPMDHTWILDKRAQALQVNLALVGAQNVWYQCSGSAPPSEVSIVESFSNSLPTKKLWKKFADYDFTITSFANDCNVFRKVTGERICNHNCDADFLDICQAGALPSDELVYKRELPKILAKMNRDPVVSDIRRSIETIVGLSADRGGGYLWQTGGLVDAWRVTSATSHDQVRVGGAATGWQAILAGDFDGDGDGDILMRNDSQLRLWLLGDKRLETETAATGNAPRTDLVFSGDIDGDRVSDLIWSESPDPRSNLFINRTWLMNAGSTTPRSITDAPAETQRVVGVGHFDADGQHRADVLYRGTVTSEVSVSLNGGSKIRLGAPEFEWVVKGIGDFNADGYSDILWYHVVGGHLAVWTTQNGDVTGDVGLGTVPVDSGWSIAGVTDIDHDGYSDIVWRNTSGAVGSWIMSGPSSVREYTPERAMSASARFVGTIEFGPPTPANKPVPVLAEAVCGVNGTLRNPGFAGYEQWWGNTFDGGGGTFLGDVDGDNKADLVSVGWDFVGVIRSTGTAFGDYETWRSDSIAGTFPTLFGDVTGDGKADLITRGNGYVKVWPSRGARFDDAGAFWYSLTFNGNRGNLVGDVDGDNDADIVALDDNGVRVLRSTGSRFSGTNGLFRSSAAYGSRGTFLGDVTGDGKADLVAVHDNIIKIFPSTGTSFAGPTTVVVTFRGTRGTLLGDVDGDGLSDLVALDDGQVRVLRARAGSFDVTGAPYYETWWSNGFYGNHANLIGDLDGNARLDIVASADGYIGAIRSQ